MLYPTKKPPIGRFLAAPPTERVQNLKLAGNKRKPK